MWYHGKRQNIHLPGIDFSHSASPGCDCRRRSRARVILVLVLSSARCDDTCRPPRLLAASHLVEVPPVENVSRAVALERKVLDRPFGGLALADPSFELVPKLLI